MNNNASTIDEVLERLDIIIADSKKNNDPLGFFAYIYRRTTAQIKQAIIEGMFEDNPRMEKFDVLFANKFLDAHNDYLDGKLVCGPWKISFDAKKANLTILQHVLLGMNAHINFDLGISSAEFQAGKPIDDLKHDFMAVNDVLASLVDELQMKVGKVSRLMFLLDWIGKRSDEEIMNFSMEKARGQAWNFALSLSKIKDQEKKLVIEKADGLISLLASKVQHPPGRFFRLIINIISRFEEKNVQKVIERLEED